MAVEPRLMTAEELLRLPRDGMRHELVRGELRTMPPAGFEHGGVTAEICACLRPYVRTHQLGQVVTGEPGFLLTVDPDTVRAPDVAFVRRERLEAVGLVRGYWPGAPDLAVEVISPNDLYTDVEEKVAEWLHYGTRLVFVVNPQASYGLSLAQQPRPRFARCHTVAAHRPGQPVRILGENDVLDGEDVVPGWSVPVRHLFK